jgi:tetratricopeptide (TPR) repeat protein
MTNAEPKTSRGAEEQSLAVPTWIVLILLAAVPVVFATGFSQFDVVKDVVLMGGVGCALVVWAVQLARQSSLGMVAGRVTILAVAVGIYVLLALAWAPSLFGSAPDAAHLVALVGMAVILSAPTGRQLAFEEFALAVGSGALLCGIFGLADWAGVGVFTTVWDPPGATGTFDAMEFATAYYAVALPVTMAGAIRQSGWTRIVLAVSLLVAGFHFGMMATWTFLGLMVGLGVAAGALIVAFEGTETFTVLAPAAVLVGALALLKLVAVQVDAPEYDQRADTSLPYLVADGNVADRRLEESKPRDPVFSIGRIEEVRSMETREYLLEVAFDLSRDQPLVGHGPGGWWAGQTRHANMDHPAVNRLFTQYAAFRSAHNGWAKFIVEYGLIGAGLLILWLLGVAAIAIGAFGRTGADPDAVAEQWGLTYSVLGGAVFMALTPLLMLAASATVFAGAVAMLTNRSAALNGYRGASMRWTWEADDDSSGWVVKSAPVAMASLVGVALLGVSFFYGASSLKRGHGDHLMLRTHYETAIDQYRAALAWLPDQGDVLYNVGAATERLGPVTGAADEIRRAAELRPWDTRVLTLRAQLAMKEKNNRDAIEYGRRAVNAYPNYIEGRKILATVLRETSQFEAAATQLVKLIERSPPDRWLSNLHFQLGQLYENMTGDLAEAKEHYEAALELTSNQADITRIEKQLQNLKKKIENKEALRQGKPPPHMGGDKHKHGPPGMPGGMPPGLKDMPKAPEAPGGGGSGSGR